MLREDACRPFIKRALDLGINFFDTADMYSVGRSEEVLGRALRDFAPRDNVVIATKVFNPMSDDPNDRGLSRKHIMTSIDRSLQRLQTDYVDLYQIHRWDPETPIEETLEALHDVVRSRQGAVHRRVQHGRVAVRAGRSISPIVHGWTRFVSMQNHYNLVYREEEREMLPLCRRRGHRRDSLEPARARISSRQPKAWSDASPTTREQTDIFAHNLYYTDADFDVAEALDAIAARSCGVAPAQVALAWLLRQPGVTAPIVGVSKLEQLEQAVAALDVTLSDEEVRAASRSRTSPTGC